VGGEERERGVDVGCGERGRGGIGVVEDVEGVEDGGRELYGEGGFGSCWH
jgi:hypothetical protein